MNLSIVAYMSRSNAGAQAVLARDAQRSLLARAAKAADPETRIALEKWAEQAGQRAIEQQEIADLGHAAATRNRRAREQERRIRERPPVDSAAAYKNKLANRPGWRDGRDFMEALGVLSWLFILYVIIRVAVHG